MTPVITDPWIVLEETFDFYHLTEMKEELWKWYKATTTGVFKTMSVKERENLAFFYEQMLKLVEASDTINRQHK